MKESSASLIFHKMKIFGVQFAPLKIPLRRRLETLAAGMWFMAIALVGSSITFLLLALIFFYTNYWFLVIIYLTWCYTLDKDTCDRGGRRVEWVRNWTWWKYLKDYFPIRLTTADGVQLDPKRNYLFCYIPHGMLATGAFSTFCTNYSEFKDLFPSHTPHVLTLKQHFHKPIFREFIYSVGMCNSSKESMNYLLDYPGGGKVAVLIVGGVAEAYFCTPGCYKSVINKRKGFVRVAMQSGCAIVPIIGFGETDIFGQLNNPKGSIIRRLQDFIKKVSGLAPLIPVGRGFLQYTFGFVPHRKPINVVVGNPMDVAKLQNPSQEEVDVVHQKFIKHMADMFEEEKHKYVEDPDKIKLEFSED